MKGSITISNHTDSIIEVIAHRNGKPEADIENKIHTIKPNEYFVFFTNKLTALHWAKPNEVSQ